VRNQFYDFKLTDTGTKFLILLWRPHTPLLAGAEVRIRDKELLFTIIWRLRSSYNRHRYSVDIDFVDISSPPFLRLNIYTAVELEFLGELEALSAPASPDSQTWTNLNEQIQGDGSFVHRLFSTRTREALYRAKRFLHPIRLIDRAQAAPGIAECIAKARLQT